MGHINFDNLVKIRNKEDVKEMPEITNPTNAVCKLCQHGKQTKVEFKTKEYSTTKTLELVHIDMCGPVRKKVLEGELYFMLHIDDYIRMTWVCFLNKKIRSF